MVGVKVKSHFDAARIVKAARRAEMRVINQAAFLVRQIAQRSIKRRKKQSKPGEPPHTRKGRLRRAIFYGVASDKQSAVVGPDYNRMGVAGGAHEHGGIYKQAMFPRRPFMGPALEEASPKFPSMWGGQIK